MGFAKHRSIPNRYIPHEHHSSHYAPFDRRGEEDFTPQPSPDAALTSFAQLAALRLGTERAYISLFDRTHQYILAEATPTLSLVSGHVESESERLMLGSCVFSKEQGLCHYVERGRDSNTEQNGNEDGVVVVLDASQDERFGSAKLLAALSDVRFYVAVPIISPRGYKIGALSVTDTKERSSGLGQHSIQFLKEMAATVMEHLAMKETTRRNRRAERMIVGLGSFVEGRSTLRDSWREAHAQQDASEAAGESVEGQLNIEQQDLQELAKQTGKETLAIREPPGKSKGDSTPKRQSMTSDRGARRDQSEDREEQPEIEFSRENNSVRAVLTSNSLKNDALPPSIRNTFSRAANLLRESIGAEGVMFLDANSDRFGSLVGQNKRKVSGFDSRNHTSSSDESAGSSSRQETSDSEQDQEADEGPRVSECLGFSSSTVSSINDEKRAGHAVVVPQPLFSSLIRRYPRGKIFTYNADGSISEDSDGLSQKSGSDADQSSSRPSSKRGRRSTFAQHAGDLIKIFEGARNILLLPIWDPDRGRWFAGTLIWTNEPDRIFTFENELVYTSAFANSIMAEIRRVDVEAAEKAKSNLVSSITHELRNPLHGILGTADILSDTAMNALQHGMVHTVESCGRTLLDTINNLLDFTFIDQYRKGDTAQTGKQKKKRNVPKTLPLGEKTSYSHVELDAVLEEVSECVFAGYCFYNHPQAPPPALTDSASRSAGQAKNSDPVGPRASQITVIFDIDPDTEWDFYTHAGAWRRILMNVFGNALKYTSTGYIYLGLNSSKRDNASSHKSGRKPKGDFDVTLTVRDTGKGIGARYLQEDLFRPFKQEDPLAAGSGLGLSIVRQAVGYLGGTIEIESTQGSGTQLSIHAPLFKSPERSETSSASTRFAGVRKQTREKTIGILGFGQALRSQRDTAMYSSLERMCTEWFGLKVTNLSPLEGKHVPFDFYLAVQTELDCEDVGGRDLFGLLDHLDTERPCLSPVVVICQSPEEAHRMFVASKNSGDPMFFEFVSQPCGPQKLARALSQCLKRQKDGESDRRGRDGQTHWVEMPDSSQLPLDVAASDPPDGRIKISKRPTTDTMGDQEDSVSRPSSAERIQTERKKSSQVEPSTKQVESKLKTPKPCVLLVDDNDLNLQLLCAYVQKEGYEYATGKNGVDAVEIYKTDPGKYQIVIIGKFLGHIIIRLSFTYSRPHVSLDLTNDTDWTILDLSMPIMDGFEASRHIRNLEKEHRAGLSEAEREALPHTVIAALSGLDSAKAQKEALGSGVNTFLIKPVKRPQVQAILQRKV